MKVILLADVKGQGKKNDVIDVFEYFVVDEHADEQISLYGGAKVTLTAFAIQATFDNTTVGIEQAWNAIVATYPYEDGNEIVTQ